MKYLLYLFLVLLLLAIVYPQKYAYVASIIISYANIFLTDILFFILTVSNHLKGTI